MKIRSKEELIHYVDGGSAVKYLCFWGHRKSPGGVTATCLSQWYESPFSVGGVRYPTAEHYMMAEKAKLFGDKGMAEQILSASNPGEAKKLGRGVEGFDERIWNEHRTRIVVEGNLAKFGQNPELKTFLLNTGERVLVEASPVDAIWGIGLAADDPAAGDPRRWRGLNLLGFALMEVRARLAGNT